MPDEAASGQHSSGAPPPPPAEPPDARPAARERARFEALLLPYLPRVHDAALRLARARAPAEDLVQETYVRAFRAFGRMPEGGNLLAWLLGILWRCACEARRAYLFAALPDDRELAGAEPALQSSPHEHLDDPDIFLDLFGDEVNRVLSGMPGEQALAVVLADVEGLTYAELAAVFGCPLGTVRSRLARARDALRRGLREHARSLGYLRKEGAP